MAISLLSVILSVGFYGLQVQENQDLKSELAEKNKLADERNRTNAENRLKNQMNASDSNVEQLETDSNVLFRALFEYSDWQSYYERTIALGTSYPLLVENPLIDTNGDNAGVGTSPKSVYKVKKIYLNQSEMTEVFLVKQTVNNGTITYEKDYYLKVTGQGQQFNVVEFIVLKELVSFK